MTDNITKVTVLTTVYNGLPYLKESIESTLNQTYSNFDFLIIDDASPDPEVIKCIRSYKDSRINLVINEENLGVSKTINKALKLIRTPYVVRSDQDDINLPDRVEEQVKFLEENPKTSIICSWEHTIDGEGKYGKDWKRSLKDYGQFLGPVLLGICPIWHPSIAFKTQAMIDCGGFKTEYVRAEDFEVTARLASKRYEAAVVPKFLLLQRQHEASQSKEFEKEQADMSNRIQKEVIEEFIKQEYSDDLSRFLRLEKPEKKKFNKEYIIFISNIMDKFFKNIALKQNLSNKELKSLKSVIYRRIGFGLFISNLLKFIPSLMFMAIFYLFSPLFINNLRQKLSRIYNCFS